MRKEVVLASLRSRIKKFLIQDPRRDSSPTPSEYKLHRSTAATEQNARVANVNMLGLSCGGMENRTMLLSHIQIPKEFTLYLSAFV
jgi:hypothetical protein